jgi:hypothetical protein
MILIGCGQSRQLAPFAFPAFSAKFPLDNVFCATRQFRPAKATAELPVDLRSPK